MNYRIEDGNTRIKKRKIPNNPKYNVRDNWDRQQNQREMNKIQYRKPSLNGLAVADF